MQSGFSNQENGHVFLTIIRALNDHPAYYEQFQAFFMGQIEDVEVIPHLMADPKTYDYKFHLNFCNLWKKFSVNQENLSNRIEMLDFFYKLREALFCEKSNLAKVKLKNLCETSLEFDDFFKERIQIFLELPEIKERIEKHKKREHTFSGMYEKLIAHINISTFSPSQKVDQVKPSEPTREKENNSVPKTEPSKSDEKKNLSKNERRKIERQRKKVEENHKKFAENHPFFAAKRQDNPRMYKREVAAKAAENDLLRDVKALDLAQADISVVRRVRNK